MRRALLFGFAVVCFCISSSATAQDAAALCDRMDVRKLLGTGDQGSPLELFCLARVYGEGKGVPRNDQTSLMYLRKSAERGFPSAQLVMGLWYESGAPGIPKDTNEALRWYKLAAAQGNVSAIDKVSQLSKAAAPTQPEEATFE